MYDTVGWACKKNLCQSPKKQCQNAERISRTKHYKLEMWANAQPDGRPAEYMWRPLFNAAKFG